MASIDRYTKKIERGFKMAKNTDFSVCEFIDENMWFFTFNDFCENDDNLKVESETNKFNNFNEKLQKN